MSTLDNVFTYRSGWYTKEAITYKGDYLLKNMEKFLSGDKTLAVWDEAEEKEDLTEAPCQKKAHKMSQILKRDCCRKRLCPDRHWLFVDLQYRSVLPLCSWCGLCCVCLRWLDA